MKGLKEELKSKLTKKELEEIITSFDIIGDIIIIEIPESLEKKQRIIGNALLKMHKAVKTVCKRAGMHEGVFRTQKLEVIAGKKTKITTYKENNALITLNVEQVYFSSRLSTERKRICEHIKEGESILVLFSGCAPYPCVISKNTRAKEIYGIEINPAGHYYGQLNVRQNKLHNVSLILGDVKRVVPHFYKHIIGLKSAVIKEEMIPRIQKKPMIMEIHLFDDELFDTKKLKRLEDGIERLQEEGVDVWIHQPFHYKDGTGYNLGGALRNEYEMLNKLGKLCKKYNTHAIIHMYTKDLKPESERKLIENLKKFKRYYPYFYFENVIVPPFNTADNIVTIGRKAGIKNVAIDVAHFMKLYKSNVKIEKAIKLLKANFDTYFHISDSDGTNEGAVIGTGKLDFERILPYVNKGIIEVRSKDETNPKEMIKSYEKIGKRIKRFDRILMPLPKSAEDFLQTALKCAKKGTIIHFYDFLHVEGFHLAEEKAKKACKKAGVKCKILDFTKCGTYSPRKYRVCLDFKVV